MSYCHKGPDSDVYVYSTKDYDKDRRRVVERFICHECNYGCNVTEDPDEMVGHLWAHREMGHKVPESAIDSLIKDGLGRQ